MKTYQVRSLNDAVTVGKLLCGLSFDKNSWDVTIKVHANKRSVYQNNLQRHWLKELETQGDQTAEQYRAYCKLHFGVPILRGDDEFKAKYDAVIKPMDYQTKLALMAEPFDFPVSRLMNTKQMTDYMDQIYVFFTGKGFVLTKPEDIF